MTLTFSNLPANAQQVRLARRPTGLPTEDDFTLATTPLSPPGAGEVLVRNRYFRVAASLRMMIAAGAEAVDGVPFGPLTPGDALAEEALGEVVALPPDGAGALALGDLVLHPLGWRDFAVVPLARCQRIAEPLPEPAAHLGHGWTTYAALLRGAAVRAGDTLFVSSGGGAIGSMAPPIARLLGATRVIGSTSTRAKGERLVAELGYDAAVTREAGDLERQLRQAAPDGIDAVLDNVGGEQLRAAVRVARPGARIALVGALAGQLAPEGNGRSAPVALDSFDLLLKRLTLRGYSADDDAALRAEWEQRFAAGLRAGTLRFPHVLVHGLAHGPRTLAEVIAGRHLGTVLIAP